MKSWKNQGNACSLKDIREKLGKFFVSASIINQFANMLKD